MKTPPPLSLSHVSSRSPATQIVINEADLSLSDIRAALAHQVTLKLSQSAWAAVKRSQAVVQKTLDEEITAYGINTGFGLLAQTRIAAKDLEQLQRNIVLSHATGVGEPLSDGVVRLLMVLKVKALAQGYSGISEATLRALMALINADVLPIIPSQGSVGASGDLAPLAHMAGALLGIGEVRLAGKSLAAVKALQQVGLKPIDLKPKEGLALLNGTQVSTALALAGLVRAQNVFAAALFSGALSVDALKGSDVPFDARIHAIRRQAGQQHVAGVFRSLLAGSAIRQSHVNCERVQDPYSLRCQPQVMGACLDLLRQAQQTLLLEANAVTDNPLVFWDDGAVLSGGNFHAEPVAFAADQIALAVCEIAAIAERRIAILVDPKMSQLPAFLVNNSGVNSGFMMAQVTAAALVAENRQRATPASVDSIPTSANQEDHVSMATHGAKRLIEMTANSAAVIGIEWLTAVQGIEFHRPTQSSPVLESAIALLRSTIAPLTQDRYLAPDIWAAQALVLSDIFAAALDDLWQA
jgi:histidine ammonia-lyase